MSVIKTVRRCIDCGAYEPVSTTCVVAAQREEHHAEHFKPENYCSAEGFVSPAGDYCERKTGHEGDHGAFECRLCWPEQHDRPTTWTVKEGHIER